MGSFLDLEGFGAAPVAATFSVDSYFGPLREVRHLRNRSGWLMMCEFRLDTVIDSFSKTALACVTEKGDTLGSWSASKLLEMRCSLPKEIFDWPPDEVHDVADALYWDFLGSCDLMQLRWLEVQQEKLDDNSRSLTAQMDGLFAKVDSKISHLRKRRRDPSRSPIERTAINAEIGMLETKMNQVESDVRQRVRNWRSEADQLELDVGEALLMEGELEVLSLVHWTTTSLRRPKRVRFPLQQEEFFRAGVNEGALATARALEPKQSKAERAERSAEHKRSEQELRLYLKKQRDKKNKIAAEKAVATLVVRPTVKPAAPVRKPKPKLRVRPPVTKATVVRNQTTLETNTSNSSKPGSELLMDMERSLIAMLEQMYPTPVEGQDEKVAPDFVQTRNSDGD